jgi:hypothetical protein
MGLKMRRCVSAEFLQRANLRDRVLALVLLRPTPIALEEI